MMLRMLATLICCGLSFSTAASKPRELANLEDALPVNRFAIEVIIFLREPAIDATLEPLQQEPPLNWPQDLMALPTLLEPQQALSLIHI